jgi:hypothetical protein
MRQSRADLAITALTSRALLDGDSETVNHMAHIATYIADLEELIEDEGFEIPAVMNTRPQSLPLSIWAKPGYRQLA